MSESLKFTREMLGSVFQDFRAAFPKLQMDYESDRPDADVSLKIPRQPGMVCDVALSLKGEELRFRAGAFQAAWFPASEERIVDLYRMAVYNWMRGEYRVLEHYRGDKVVKAELQCPLDNGDWKTIEAWSVFSLPFGGKVTTKELINAAASGSAGRVPS
jgi:hypothetical protein